MTTQLSSVARGLAIAGLLFLASTEGIPAEQALLPATETPESRIAALRAEGLYREALAVARADLERLRMEGTITASWEVSDAQRRIAAIEQILSLEPVARERLAAADRLAVEQGEYSESCQYDKALAVAESRLETYRDVLATNGLELIPLLTDLGNYVRKIEEFERAEAWLGDALETGRESLGPAHPWIADALTGLARIRMEQSEYTKAEALLTEALSLRRNLHGDRHTAVADALHRLSNVKRRLQRLDEAAAAGREALEMSRAMLGDGHTATAAAALALGEAIRVQGHYAEAERLFQQALGVIRRQPPSCGMDTVSALWGLAGVYFHQGDLQEAREIIREIQGIYAELKIDDGQCITCLNNLGVVSHSLGDHKAAAGYLREALAVVERLEGADKAKVSVNRANLARALTSMGEYEEAQRLLESILEETEGPGKEDLQHTRGTAIHYLAVLHDRMGHYEQAEVYHKRSIQSQNENIDEGHRDVVLARRMLGEARVGQGDLKGALSAFVSATQAFEKGRKKAGEGIRAATFRQTPYESLALARLEAGQTGRAWADLERARGRLLEESLLSQPGPFSLERVQGVLPRQGAIVGWIDHNLRWDQPRSWAYVIRKTGPVRWVRLVPEKTSGGNEPGRLGAYRAVLSEAADSPFPPTVTASLEEDSHRLWSERIEPLLSHLEGVEDLVVVPSGAMGGVPVEALMDGDARYVGETFTVSYAISSTIHTWLAERETRKGPLRKALLLGDPVFSGSAEKSQLAKLRGTPAELPAEKEKILRDAVMGDSHALSRLPRLASSGEEVRGVARLLPESTVLLRDQATEGSLARLAGSGALSEFDVIHLATHALVDNRKPARTALVVSQPQVSPGNSSENDGLVTAEEIAAGWKLNADLVTLSACETAMGRQIFGEGIVGFAYPLLQAGARSLLVSLWKVDDRATALLMNRFYEEWIGDASTGSPGVRVRSKTAALQAAKRWLREYRDNSGRRPYEHPSYWAAFVLIGQGT